MALSSVRRLELSLQFSVACMATLGTTLLGLGQHSQLLPALALVSSIVSFVFTDLLRVLVLRQWMTNLLMIIALGVVAVDLARASGFVNVLAMADLLVYLQCILQFQTKNTRVFRYLVTLSAFQVVSASAFYHGVLFGTLLIVYLLNSLIVMVMLAFYEVWQKQMEHHKEGSQPQTVSHRLVGDRIPDSSPLGFNGRLLARTLFLGVGSLAFALVVFMVVPRLSSRPWPGLSPAPLRTVGFDRQIALGELGFLVEDSTPVMRVEVTDMDGNPATVMAPVYLRGGSYTFYRNGQWETNQFIVGGEVQNLKPLYRGPGQSLHRQRIILEPLDTSDVFGIWPYGRWDDAPLVYDPLLTRLFRLSDRPSRISYEMTTSAIENERLVDIVPATEPVAREQYLQLPWVRVVPTWLGPRFEVDRTVYELRGWDRVVKLARQWAAESPWPANDHFHTARFFEQQLAYSGYYRYSLAGVTRNATLDPVVDFLTEHPEGHCEYFATALALLLRCQGIPTRIVIGYKTYDYNTLGHFYQVRQRDAHAWVEVYLAPNQITQDLVGERPLELFRFGAWLRLDPMPASALGLASSQGPWQRFWNAYNFLDYIWLKYVMQMDQPRQETEIYRPVRERVRKQVDWFLDLRWWRQQVTLVVEQLREILANPLRITVLAIGLGFLALLVWKVVRILRNPTWSLWLANRLPRRLRDSQLSEHLATAVYRHLEHLLSRQGYRRATGQTPRQFAGSVIQAARADNSACPWADTVLYAVSLYYRLRFGNGLARPRDWDELGRVVAELDRTFSRKRTVRRAKTAHSDGLK